MGIDDILKECEGYQEYLQEVWGDDDINFLINRATTISAYHARIGYLLAEAKDLQRIAKTAEVNKAITTILKQQNLSIKVQNVMVEGLAARESKAVDWLDRLNSMCVHQMDLLRTIISKVKEEMKYQNFNTYDRK